jgi:speckle-type POZ protein
MLNFMYRFDYDAGSSDHASASPMIFHVKVYSIADKYDVPMLKSQAREKFEKVAETCWNMDDFPHALTEIYSSTPRTDRGLRDLAVEIVCRQIKTLLEKQDFQTVLDETLGLAADVSRYMANGKALTQCRCYQCPACGNRWEAVLSPRTTYHCIHCGSSYPSWEELAMNVG